MTSHKCPNCGFTEFRILKYYDGQLSPTIVCAKCGRRNTNEVKNFMKYKKVDNLTK